MNFLILSAAVLLLREVECLSHSSEGLSHASHEWSYSGEKGPDSWPGLCNTGDRQSPIDIVTDDAIKTHQSPLRFVKYGLAFTADVTNTGHTIQVVTRGLPLHLKSRALPFDYVFEQMHFHWDSEHTINGKHDALELHLVHYAKKYNNATYASGFENGIAVVAVLFEISKADNEYLKPILEATKSVSSMSVLTSTRLKTKLVPSVLLPKDHSYYRYYGSLTTPNCQEAVIWTVFRTKMPISASQLEVFRNVRDADNELLPHNNRPIQKLGSRKVYYHRW